MDLGRDVCDVLRFLMLLWSDVDEIEILLLARDLEWEDEGLK